MTRFSMRDILTDLFYVLVVGVLLIMSGGDASAKPQIVSWQMPTTDCDGDPLPAADLLSFELIYDTEPMPMPSDTAGPCGATEDPGPPATATVVNVPVTQTSTILNLQPGVTYYFRARISAYISGNWSAWSVEISKTVPYGRPDRVIVSDGRLSFTSELIEDPPIRLN